MSLRILVFLSALFASVVHGQTAWTVTRFGIPNADTPGGIAYGKGRFVAVVQGGPRGLRIVTSSDGISWQETSVNAAGFRLTYFADHFILFGGGGVWRSPDGQIWQQMYNHYADYAGTSVQRGTHNERGMLLDAGFFNGVLIHSGDMTSWTRTTALPNSGLPGASVSITHMAFGGGRYFVAYSISAPGANGSYTASSVDGRSWTLVPDLQFAQGLAGGNGRLVALVPGRALVTTDGTTFTSSPTATDMFNPQGLFFAGGRFITARNLYMSVDGLSWAPLATFNKPETANISGVAYGGGRYVAVGSNPFATSAGDLLAYLSAAAPPLIATQPAARTQAEGGRATFSVAIENPDLATTFQWRRDGSVIAGATGSSYTIDPITRASAGRYAVEIRNTIGTSTSLPALLTVVPITEAGRIINLSVLTSIDVSSGPESSFTVGFVVGGSGTTGNKALLVRAGGPSLTRFGVVAPLVDPQLELFTGALKIAENDNWNGSGNLTDVGVRVGAFPFSATDSKDAAVFTETIASGDASVRLSAKGGATGAVLAEVYDATPLIALTVATPRLVNLSVLKSISAGTTLSAGFVIGGVTSKTVLIRAIGPGLAPFNVSSPLPDPTLVVLQSGVAAALAVNDNWGGTSELSSTFGGVGAFNLAPNSRDSALLLTLAPGNYVAQASGVGTAGGVALIEIYEVP